MSEGNGSGDNVIGVRTVYDAVLRLDGKLEAMESKFTQRAEQTDVRVDDVIRRHERLEGRLEGSFGMVKWLGPAGVVAVIFGIARATGVL